jgi:hypothetical protein
MNISLNPPLPPPEGDKSPIKGEEVFKLYTNINKVRT